MAVSGRARRPLPPPSRCPTCTWQPQVSSSDTVSPNRRPISRYRSFDDSVGSTASGDVPSAANRAPADSAARAAAARARRSSPPTSSRVAHGRVALSSCSRWSSPVSSAPCPAGQRHVRHRPRAPGVRVDQQVLLLDPDRARHRRSIAYASQDRRSAPPTRRQGRLDAQADAVAEQYTADAGQGGGDDQEQVGERHGGLLRTRSGARAGSWRRRRGRARSGGDRASCPTRVDGYCATPAVDRSTRSCPTSRLNNATIA